MLISLLVAVIILGLLAYCVSLLPLPQPWKNIALVILIIIAIVWLVGYLPDSGWYHHRY